MPERSPDDAVDGDRSKPGLDAQPTEAGAESDDSSDEVLDSGKRAIAELGLEARAELERLRARLGLLAGKPPPSPTIVDRYRLLGRVGHGGMGVVYRAFDPNLDREVAIKLVHAPSGAAAPSLRARLLREAKVLAQLAHANIVRVYDCGEHEGEVYLAMEYVEGQTLRLWQAGRSPAELVEAYLAAAAGLAAAHREGIVHRDFKPENVLVAADGRILVGDFGLAVGALEPTTPPPTEGIDASEPTLPTMTKTGALLGTVLYMSPEQLRGDQVTARSDQFSLCVALWEALTRRLPFEGEDQASLLASIERDRPRGGERLPGRLRRPLARGLSLDPADRFASIDALVAAIRRRRGVSAPLLVALVGASLGAGMLAYPAMFEPAPARECGLERAVVRVRESGGWAAVQTRLRVAGTSAGLERLDLHLRRLDEQAHALCQGNASPGEEAKRQHLQAWVENLGSLLETGSTRELGAVLEDIESLEHARLTAPPPRALDEKVLAAVQRSQAQERHGDLDGALASAEDALKRARSRHLELAVAHVRRGRVQAQRERHASAMDDYGLAASNADAAAYDDARLDALVFAARTAIMRLEQLERGRDALHGIAGLLVRLDEPWWSVRWADYRELDAALLKREGKFPEALREQWASLVLRTLHGEVHQTGLGYINLGTTYERHAQEMGTDAADDLQRALTLYQRALDLLEPTRPSPAWGLAAYELGRALVSSGPPEGYDRAEQLLEDVRRERADMRLLATKDLLLLRLVKVQSGEPSEPAHLRALADELLELLASPPDSASQALDAWSYVAAAYAELGQLEPFERALLEVDIAATTLRRLGTVPSQVLVRQAQLELTAADALVDDHRERALALARSARERLGAVPRPPSELVAFADEMLAASPG